VTDENTVRVVEAGGGILATVAGFLWRRHVKLERQLARMVTRDELGHTLESLSERLDQHAAAAQAAEVRATEYREAAKSTMHRMAMHLAVIGTTLKVPPPEGYDSNHEG
jgi:hypothetical protein